METSTVIKSVNVLITTACSRRCPLCCYRDLLSSRPNEFFSVQDVAAEVALCDSAEIVYLLGGEPTLHPQLDLVLEAARKARPSKTLVLVSNGARLREWKQSLRFVDRVWITNFGQAAEVVNSLGWQKPSHFDIVEANHVDYGGGPKACVLHMFTASVLNRRVYPCCVACGILDADSAPLQEGWEAAVARVKPPCERCVFGRKGATQ